MGIVGIGDWGLGIGDWGLGPMPNPRSAIPNPPSPFLVIMFEFSKIFFISKNIKIIILNKCRKEQILSLVF